MLLLPPRTQPARPHRQCQDVGQQQKQQKQQKQKLSLQFRDTPLDGGGGSAFEALAGALRRGALRDLRVVACSIDAASCKLLVQAAADSPSGVGTLLLGNDYSDDRDP